MSTLNFDKWQNRAGTEEFFKCRAFVNFNGTGTVAIRASGNVSSITDNGTGQFVVNLTNNMPDANYTVTAMLEASASGGSASRTVTLKDSDLPTISTVPLRTINTVATQVDPSVVCAAIFR